MLTLSQNIFSPSFLSKNDNKSFKQTRYCKHSVNAHMLPLHKFSEVCMCLQICKDYQLWIVL